MSLGARRDYHEFLTTPIIRQALTVIVPEYDRVALVLTKPVRAGLHSLAQGTLLQAFALTVGIGRIAEDPVSLTNSGPPSLINTGTESHEPQSVIQGSA